MSLIENCSKNLEELLNKLVKLDKQINDYDPSKGLLKNKEGLEDFDSILELLEKDLKDIISEKKNDSELSEQSMKEITNEIKSKIEKIKNKYNEKKNSAKDIQQNEKKEDECKENNGDSNKIKETDNCMGTATGETADEENTQSKSCMRCNIF